MDAPEQVETAAWEAAEKAIKEEHEMAKMEELEKATENIDVAGDSESSSPSTASLLASFPIPPSGYPPLPDSSDSSASSSSASSSTESTAGSNATMNSHPDPNTILDRHEKAVADILKRFLNMVVAATEPIDEGYTPEKASLNQMQMETETAALVKAIENLLGITREIRRLWLTGPLVSVATADQRDKARDAAIDAKTERICGLFNQWITLREEKQREGRRRLAEKRKLEQEQQQGSDINNATTGPESAAAAGAADLGAGSAAAGGSATGGAAAGQAGGMA